VTPWQNSGVRTRLLGGCPYEWIAREFVAERQHLAAKFEYHAVQKSSGKLAAKIG